MTTTKASEKLEAAEMLRKAFPPGSTARTILRHVAASGMTRWISVIGADQDTGEPRDYTWAVARVLGEKYGGGTRHEGIKVGGYGMDMGFHLVYGMSSALYPDGFDCIQFTPEGVNLGEDDRSRRCPSNDHSNGQHGYAHHENGGYAVNHRWL